MDVIILNLGPIYWLYFASLILIGTFIAINLFISVKVRKSEETYQSTCTARTPDSSDATGECRRDQRSIEYYRR